MTLVQIIQEAKYAGDWHTVAVAQRAKYGLEAIGDGAIGQMSLDENDSARSMSRGQALDWLESNGWEIKL